MKFIAILFTEFWELMRLNLLFLLTCLGIVTIPAAAASMANITVHMVRDTNHYLLQDYFAVFKKKFGKCLAVGLTFGLGILACGAAVFLYGTMGAEGNPVFYVLAGIAASLVLLLLAVAAFAFPMLALTDLSFGQIFRVSVKLARNFPGRALAGVLIDLLLLLAAYLTDPGSIIFTVFIMFSLMSLISVFFICPGLDAAQAQMEKSAADSRAEA